MFLLRRNKNNISSILQKGIFINSVDLKGVISKIYHKDPKNFHKNVIASTDASDVDIKNLYNALDPTTKADERFISTESRNTTFSFKLKNMKINIKSYTLVSEDTGIGNAQLRNWNFSCSTNDKKWDILHSAVNNGDLNGKSITKTYPIKSLDYYSRCKMTQTGPSWDLSNPNYFIFQQIDLNGDFIFIDKLCTSCYKQRNLTFKFSFIALLFS